MPQQTITRKNALFAGSDGGRTPATIATLLQTAKMNGVDPFALLTRPFSLHRWRLVEPRSRPTPAIQPHRRLNGRGWTLTLDELATKRPQKFLYSTVVQHGVIKGLP